LKHSHLVIFAKFNPSLLIRNQESTMANNGGRQAGGGGNGQMNEHVEFTVKVCTVLVAVVAAGGVRSA
jgi:hypothetical protein